MGFQIFGTKHLGVDMPTHDGRKLVSESATERRGRNQALVRMNIEVSLSDTLMKEQPNWARDAIQFMRGYIAGAKEPETFLTNLAHTEGVTVTAVNIEVAR